MSATKNIQDSTIDPDTFKGIHPKVKIHNYHFGTLKSS